MTSEYVAGMSLSNVDGSTGVYFGFANALKQRHGVGKSIWTEGPRKGDVEHSRYANGVRYGFNVYSMAKGEHRIGQYNDQGRISGTAVRFCVNGERILHQWNNGKDVGKTLAGIVAAGFLLTGEITIAFDYERLGVPKPTEEEVMEMERFERSLRERALQDATRIAQTVQDYRIDFGNGSVIFYSGSLNGNGLRHGTGFTRWIDGPLLGYMEYTQYYNGSRRGYFLFVWPDGDRRVGCYSDNGIDQGVSVWLSHTNGVKYFETWLNGNKSSISPDSVKVAAFLDEWQAAMVAAGYKIVGDMDVAYGLRSISPPERPLGLDLRSL